MRATASRVFEARVYWNCYIYKHTAFALLMFTRRQKSSHSSGLVSLTVLLVS